MFSGIIEKTTKTLHIEVKGTNKIFTFENPFDEPLYIDQSISHNGACLTVIALDDKSYKVEAIKETLDITNLDALKVGDFVNLERSVQAKTRLDGHIVQGHVDSTAIVKEVKEMQGSWEIVLEIPKSKEHLVIPKGSIALNGISLTLKSVKDNMIEVAIIPYTYEHTNIHNWKEGSIVNVEYDMLGKYIVAYMEKINAR